MSGYVVTVDDGTELLYFEVDARDIPEALATAGRLFDAGEYEVTR